MIENIIVSSLQVAFYIGLTVEKEGIDINQLWKRITGFARDSNPRPFDHESEPLPLSYPVSCLPLNSYNWNILAHPNYVAITRFKSTHYNSCHSLPPKYCRPSRPIYMGNFATSTKSQQNLKAQHILIHLILLFKYDIFRECHVFLKP